MICWINPFTGLAGDMLLAALLDVGAPLRRVRDAISATGLTGWELTCDRITTHGLSASWVRVRVRDTQTERSAADLMALAARASPQPVADMAVRAFTAIAESQLHRGNPASIHLPGLGGHDTLIDIVGTAAALHALGVTEVYSSPLPLGSGHVRSAHGILPCPAPATMALLAGAAVTGSDLPGETVTPTAAALLRAACARYDPPPPMALARTGYGAGTRRLPDRPNVASATLGITQRAAASEPVDVLETNLDDVTGELLGYVIAQALEAGALDAWVTPGVMKKGRPAHVLHVLARPEKTPALQDLVLAETGTLDIRRITIHRTVLNQYSTTVYVNGIPVRIKFGPHGAKPEHDDVAEAAARLGMPLRDVTRRALTMLGSQHTHNPTAGKTHRDDL